MIRQTFRGIVQLLGALGAGLAIMLMVVAWQLSSGPISLGFLSPHIENLINSKQRDFKLVMKDTILTWAGWDRTLDIRVLGVKVLRQDGSLVGSVPEVSFSLSGQALISGLLAPRSIELFGPRLRVSRNLSGDIGIGFMETEAQSKDFALRLLNQLLAEPDKDNPMSYLTRLEVVSAEITLDDQLLGRSWVTQEANVSLRRDAVGLVADISLALDVQGRQTEISATIGYQTAGRRLDMTVNFSEVSPAVFSSLYYELGPLRALALPLKGTVTVGMSLDGIIEAANFNLSGGRGVLNLPSPFKQSLPVNGVSLKGIYEGGEDRFDIEEMNIDLGAKGSLLLPAPIGHKMPLASLRLKGRYLGKTGRLEITDIVADLGGPSAKASAVVDGFGGIQDIATANMSIDFKGSIKGVAVDQLDRYWPVALGTDAHRWIMAHFSDGEIHQARAEMQLWLENGDLELVSLDGDMDVSGVSVDYLPPMPKVRNAAAYMKFDEKNFNIFISKGVSETLKLTDASVLISGLDEYDQIANITVAIEGAFGDKLAYLDNEPLRYAQAIGVDPGDARRLEIRLVRDHVHVVHRHGPALPAIMVNHLVAGDGQQPAAKGTDGVIGRPAAMDGNQHFLHQILDIFRLRAAASAIICAQQGHQRAQQACMRGGVALQAADHPFPQLLLVCLHARSRPPFGGGRAMVTTQRRGHEKFFSVTGRSGAPNGLA